MVYFECSTFEIHHDTYIDDEGRLNDSGSIFSEDSLYGRIPAGINLKRQEMARILFVDDDPHTLETLDKSTQLLGHQAIIAKSGEEALKLAAVHSPDLIMTDMRLPDMNGLALIEQLRQNDATASVPVVVLSASPEVDIAQLSEQAGADSFLSKPIRLQTLQNVIEHYTSGSRDPEVSAD